MNDEHVLLTVLIQLLVIVVAACALAAVARRLGQPAVVGEIAAGVHSSERVLAGPFSLSLAQAFTPGTRIKETSVQPLQGLP